MPTVVPAILVATVVPAVPIPIGDHFKDAHLASRSQNGLTSDDIGQVNYGLVGIHRVGLCLTNEKDRHNKSDGEQENSEYTLFH
jgi:hypothetical protein